MAALTVTAERQQVVDFTVAFHHEPGGLLFRIPATDDKLMVYLFPFKQEVWIALFAAVLLIAICFTFTMRYGEPKRDTRPFSWLFLLVHTSMDTCTNISSGRNVSYSYLKEF